MGTCSLQQPGEERAVLDPIFLPDEGTEGQRAPAAFSPLLRGWRRCLISSISLLASSALSSRPLLATWLWYIGLMRPIPQVCGHRIRCGWCGQCCSRGMERGPVLKNWIPTSVYQLWAQGMIRPFCASVSPFSKATVSWDYMSSSR